MDSDGAEPEAPAVHRVIFRRGLIASVIYLFSITIYVVFEWSHLLRLDPSEFATFLGGVFSPLAFLWLVLGFIQQGRELGAQIEELRHSVKAQNDLVSATREQHAFDAQALAEAQAETERASAPVLRISRNGSSTTGTGHIDFAFMLTNTGADCSGLEVKVDGQLRLVKPVLQRGEQATFQFQAVIAEPKYYPATIFFRDSRGNSQVEYASFKTEGTDVKIMQPNREASEV